MSSRHAGWLTIVPLALAFAVGGCCKKEKQQIQALQEQYNDLSNQNQDLRSQLSEAKARNNALMSELNTKESQLSSAEARAAELQSELAATPAPTPTAETAEGWTVTVVGDKITVGSDVLFASGKAELTSGGKRALDKIAGDLRTTYAGLPVRVMGYTDTDPIRKSKWKDNLELSAHRAMAVERYLESRGVEPERMESVAKGEEHPVPGSKTKSRRVEIIVVKQP